MKWLIGMEQGVWRINEFWTVAFRDYLNQWDAMKAALFNVARFNTTGC